MKSVKLIQFVINRSEKWKWRGVEDKPFEPTSMGDIAFLLLIFFIITSSFILKEGIFFSLPSKTGSVRIEENKIIEVYPRNRGFTINGEYVSRKGLKFIFQEKKKTIRDAVVVIRMGPDVRYERLVDTLSLARETGIKRISLKNAEEKQ